MRFLDNFRAATLFTLGGFILVSAVQSACSSPADDGSGNTSGIDTDSTTECPAGSKASTLDGVTACCAGTECATADSLTLGGGCHVAGLTAKVDQRSFVRDTCIIDSCSGDETSESYAATAVHEVGTAVCKETSGKLTWIWQKTPTLHTIDRSCDVVGALVCGSDGYGYGYGGYGETGYGESGYGDGYGDGYGYGSSSGHAARAVVTSADTCTGPDTALCTDDHL